jgi:hypothetical protein
MTNNIEPGIMNNTTPATTSRAPNPIRKFFIMYLFFFALIEFYDSLVKDATLDLLLGMTKC